MKKLLSITCLLLLTGTTGINAQAAATKKTTAATSPAKASTATTTFKDERDGEEYKTAVIDGKTWMLQPFRYKPEKCDCIYWEESDKSKGAFYSITQAKNVIPEGWRIPTTEEYEALLAKVGKTPEALIKAGFSIDMLEFNLDMYKTINQYKNDAYMTSVLVGDKKAFNIQDATYFFALYIIKNKLADGTEYESVDNRSLQVAKDGVKVWPGLPGNSYIRMFLIKS